MKKAWPMRWWITGILVMVATLSFLTLLVGAMVREAVLNGDEATTAEWRVRQRLGERQMWRDAEWQSAMLQDLTMAGADLTLMDPAGGTIFSSSGAPLRPPGTPAQSPGRSRRVEVMAVRDLTGAPVGPAYLYGRWDSPPSGSIIWSQAFLMFAMLIGGVVLSSLLASWIFALRFLAPLRGLVAAAEQVRQGRFDIHLKGARVHEVAVVLDAFQKMTGDLSRSIARQSEMEEERRFFMASISHDLRTPLFSLRGRIEGIRDGLAATPEQVGHYVHNALRSLDALDRLVADLFAYTKLNLLEQALAKEPVDLAALIKRVAEEFQPQTRSRQVQLGLLGMDYPCWLVGDPYFLHRAFSNLLDNALRYTPEGGSTWVELTIQQGRIVVRVHDSGPGFAPDLLPHLFSPMHRGEASRSRKTGGAGLGLAIAGRIVEAHGGTISAGNGDNRGACITVMLPSGSETGGV